MKIGFFITARLKSSRLQHKILLDLNGKSVLDRVIERCQQVKGVDGIVLCTSTNPQDSILYENALKNDIQFYPGSEDDVLDRLLAAAEYYAYDAFLSITSDNPLFSFYNAQLMVDWYRQEQPDFIYTKGLPIGCSPTMIDYQALRVAHHIKQHSDTEIWGPFINRPDFFKVGELQVTNSPFEKGKRLTCDYPEDYTLIRTIYNHFEPSRTPSFHDVAELLTNQPEIWKLNKKHRQKQLEEAVRQQIDQTFQENTEEGKAFAIKIGKTLEPAHLRRELTI